MKTISGIEFASEHNGTDVFRLIELAYEQGWKDGHSEQLGTNLAEVGTDTISRQAAINKILGQPPEPHYPSWYAEQIKELPPAQLIRCCECKYLQCNMRPDGYLPKGVDEFECRHWCGSCDPMDFCSQAERREVTT